VVRRSRRTRPRHPPQTAGDTRKEGSENLTGFLKKRKSRRGVQVEKEKVILNFDRGRRQGRGLAPERREKKHHQKEVPFAQERRGKKANRTWAEKVAVPPPKKKKERQCCRASENGRVHTFVREGGGKKGREDARFQKKRVAFRRKKGERRPPKEKTI